MIPKVERSFEYIEGKHVPTLKILLEPCTADDSNAWDARDALADRIELLLAAPAVERQEPVVPDGWKLVPIEPTAEMLAPIAHSRWPDDWDAGKHLQRLRGVAVVLSKCEVECAVGQYARMLAATPEYTDTVKELTP